MTCLEAPDRVAQCCNGQLKIGRLDRPDAGQQAVAAEHFAVVHGFGHAIGEQAEQIAGLQLHRGGKVGVIAGGTQRRPRNVGGIDVQQTAIAPHDGSIMAGAGIFHVAGRDVENADESRDKQVFRIIPVQFAFDVAQRQSEVILAPGQRAGQGLRDRHEQAGRHAFAGDIADCQAEPAFVEHEAVVVVTTHRLGRFEQGGD